MNWKQQLKNSVHEYHELAVKWDVKDDLLSDVTDAFPLQITPHYLSLIDDKNPDDPLKKIVAPQNAELTNFGVEDTMGEHTDYRVKGLQHRYPETALLIINNFCASYCRFCFRKRIFNPLNLEDERINDIEPAIGYIQAHDEISNVLFSGGDPMVSSTKKINSILTLLSGIDHLDYVRIGTKVLAFLPQRIYEDESLLAGFASFTAKKPLQLISHFDHAHELSTETGTAVRELLKVGVKNYGHVVLLKGINDNTTDLVDLFDKMSKMNIAPYYIFHPMPVTGTEHFQITLKEGIDLIREASKKLSGLSKQFRYILPHYIGKTEVLGYDSAYFYFKQHQSRITRNVGRMFKVSFNEQRSWFNDDEMIFL